MTKLYQKIASTIVAMRNCERSGNAEWLEKHGDALKELMNTMPSGGGFDSGTLIDLDQSGDSRLVFSTSFHHMNDGGYYDGWTEHRVIVTPTLSSGFDLRVTGRNRNDIKDHIAETFSVCLSNDV